MTVRSSAAPTVAPVDASANAEALRRPLFVIAVPRAGGSLLLDLVAHSRHVWTIDQEGHGSLRRIRGLNPAEHGWESHVLTDLDTAPQTVSEMKAAMMANLRDHRHRRFFDLVERQRPNASTLVEMAHENCLRVPFLAEAFPDAVFVYVHRDARQNVSSLLEAWQLADDSEAVYPPGWSRGPWHFMLPEGWRAYDSRPLLEVAAFQWGAGNQRALDDLELLGPDRWIDVDYAELLAAPRAVTARVFALAGLEVDDAMNAVLDRPLPLRGERPPSPLKWRENRAFGESALGRYNLVRCRLRELGGTPAPPPPPAWQRTDSGLRYSTFVEDAPVLPPDRASERVVHPSFQFQLGATVPLPLVRRTRFRDRFLAGFPLAWYEDAGTGVLNPFWVRREHALIVDRLRAGQPTPRGLGEVLVGQLAAVGILVTDSELDRRRREAGALAESARRQFETRRYCELASLVHPTHVASLARYYDALMAQGCWAIGDAQVANRHGWHNESVARYFHHQLCGFVGRAVGERVRPSYCYVSAYRRAAVLRPHVDRKQCVFTVSLWIGHASASAGNLWPLWLHSPEGVVSVTQAAGDAVLFAGCELPHWRDTPPPGVSGTTLILHYVPHDFVGVLD